MASFAMGLLASFFFLTSFVTAGFLISWEAATASLLRPARMLGLAVIAGLFVGPWMVYRIPKSHRALLIADAVGTILMISLLSLSSTVASFELASVLQTVMAASYVLTLRAVFLPTPTSHTLKVSVLAMVASALTIQAGIFFDLGHGMPNRAELLHAGGRAGGVMAWANFALWALLSIGSAMICARIIWGLRQRLEASNRVGHYVLGERVGQGGAGVVYRATHALLKRETAVKFLPAERMDQTSVARFEREVQTTAQLTHPNTVAVYDYGRTEEGVFYYAMEYLDGLDLELLTASEGPLPPARVVHILAQLCRSLSEAHGHGLIHRDVKPANIILIERAGESDVVKVVDFGLVKPIESSGLDNVTQENKIAGTPHYLAPEVILASADVGPQSDIYAVAAVGYCLLTGKTVFEGKSVVEVCAYHLHTVPVPPHVRAGRAIPAEIETVILRGLAKKPEDRYPDAKTLLIELEALARLHPWTNHDASLWWQEKGRALKDRNAQKKRLDSVRPGTLTPR